MESDIFFQGFPSWGFDFSPRVGIKSIFDFFFEIFVASLFPSMGCAQVRWFSVPVFRASSLGLFVGIPSSGCAGGKRKKETKTVSIATEMTGEGTYRTADPLGPSREVGFEHQNVVASNGRARQPEGPCCSACRATNSRGCLGPYLDTLAQFEDYFWLWYLARVCNCPRSGPLHSSSERNVSKSVLSNP